MSANGCHHGMPSRLRRSRCNVEKPTGLMPLAVRSTESPRCVATSRGRAMQTRIPGGTCGQSPGGAIAIRRSTDADSLSPSAMVDLRHLRYFVTVAEELHFRRAADRLRVAQPALSRQVGRLERSLGVALLRRTNRRVELTPAGRLFLDGARETLAQAERAVETVQRAAEGEVGRLRVLYGATSELGLFPELLPRFLGRYPHVVLDLQN